jgi:hypothetical protein
MTIYTKWRLAFATQELRQPIEDLRDIVKEQDGIALWGIWRGIFGVGSNELLLVTAQSGKNNSLQLPSYCRTLEAHRLRATARPLTPEPPAMPGIYVFRDFALNRKDIQEVVALSSAAWQTFETGDNYQAQPIGLFAPLNPEEECLMHLLTWYPDFNSWQNSRESDSQALQRFSARRAITHSTIAVATRLDVP